MSWIYEVILTNFNIKYLVNDNKKLDLKTVYFNIVIKHLSVILQIYITLYKIVNSFLNIFEKKYNNYKKINIYGGGDVSFLLLLIKKRFCVLYSKTSTFI